MPSKALCLRVHQLISIGERDLLPRRIHRDPVLLRELGQRASLAVVARLGPRIDRAFAQRAIGVGNDQRLVVLEHRAEAVARRARAARIVEREELRRGRRRAGAVVRALEALGVSRDTGVASSLCVPAPASRRNRAASSTIASPSPSRNAVPTASARRCRLSGADGQAIDHHQQLAPPA